MAAIARDGVVGLLAEHVFVPLLVGCPQEAMVAVHAGVRCFFCCRFWFLLRLMFLMLSRAVAAAAADRSCVCRFLLEPGEEEEKPRSGSELRLPLGMSDFKPLLAIKAKVTTHSGCMEMEAV